MKYHTPPPVYQVLHEMESYYYSILHEMESLFLCCFHEMESYSQNGANEQLKGGARGVNCAPKLGRDKS